MKIAMVCAVACAPLLAGAAHAGIPCGVERDFTAKEYAAFIKQLSESCESCTPPALRKAYVLLDPAVARSSCRSRVIC